MEHSGDKVVELGIVEYFFPIVFDDRSSSVDVTLALETYEQVSTADLLTIVEAVGDPDLGICLDPANVVARLENPRETIDLCAEHVVNLHVKDFRFERQSGLIGLC